MNESHQSAAPARQKFLRGGAGGGALGACETARNKVHLLLVFPNSPVIWPFVMSPKAPRRRLCWKNKGLKQETSFARGLMCFFFFAGGSIARLLFFFLFHYFWKEINALASVNVQRGSSWRGSDAALRPSAEAAEALRLYAVGRNQPSPPTPPTGKLHLEHKAICKGKLGGAGGTRSLCKFLS